MTTVDREVFLGVLRSVEAGLSRGLGDGDVEQSSAFIFRGKQVLTYNEQVHCRIDSGLKKVEGAVPAKPLLAILGKLTESDIGIEFNDRRLIIKGDRKLTEIRFDKKIRIPLGDTEEPGEWQEIHPDFNDALKLVLTCTSDKKDQWRLSCVHIHPEWIEATDNFRGIRYKFKTGMTMPHLISGRAIKPITEFDMVEFSETPVWLHFRNHSGLIYSCKRTLGEYHDITEMFNIEGQEITLPKNLGEAATRAEIFSADNKDSNIVKVEVKENKLKITGEGLSGRHIEYPEVIYNGPPLSFSAKPSLIVELVDRDTICLLSRVKLLIKGKKWRYFTIINLPEETEE